MGELYVPTKGDIEIFKRAEKDPNFFLNYYMRSPQSGTWWFPGAKTAIWKEGYDQVYEYWKSLNSPDNFELGGYQYRVEKEHEESVKYPDSPAFFHNHGILLLPWAEPLYLDRHPFVPIVGGFGSGKTLNLLLINLVRAAILPGFRAFGLAPYAIQANEIYRLGLDIIRGTIYEERFLIGSPKKPFPTLVIGHEGVGKNTIECYPILNNSDKIRTLTGDCAIIDQSEKLDDLEEVIRDIGTRFRGRVPSTGRSRIGTLTFLANSGDSQPLWDLYDMAEEDPENYLSLSPSSYDNIYLTDADLHRFEMQVGSSEELKRQYLYGERPVGNGEHFSRAVIESIMDPELDRIMEAGKALGKSDYIHLQAKPMGTYEWLLPKVEGRRYAVISDPGTKNPPHRDSPPIFIWDITDFPGDARNRQTMKMVGFVWVFGNDNIQNWATRYAEMVHRYDAHGTNGFDATGFQSGYDQWMAILENLHAEKINLGGNNKFMVLNAAKILTTAKMMAVPKAIKVLFTQLARYEYPEPKRLRQDVAIAFMMSCWWAQRLYFYDDSEGDGESYDPQDRYYRQPVSRYGGHSR